MDNTEKMEEAGLGGRSKGRGQIMNQGEEYGRRRRIWKEGQGMKDNNVQKENMKEESMGERAERRQKIQR